MRINLDQKSVDMEQRDINYILPAYIRNYLFYSKNEDPVEIVFPMFSSAPHPTKPGVKVPIRWVPELSPEAMEISVDGKDVREATEEEIVVEDEVDTTRKEVKAELGLTPAPEDHTADDARYDYERDRAEDVSPARAAFAEVAKEEPPADVPFNVGTDPPPSDRVPKKPEHEAPPGSQLSDMSRRDPTDQRQVAKDLVPEPEIDESKEVEVDIKKPEEQSGDTSGQ